MTRNAAKTKTKTKTDATSRPLDFDAVFQKSIELLSDGTPIKKMLATIGMTWGQYWPRVSHTSERRNAYADAISTRNEYFKLLAADRLAEAALCETREIPTAKGVVSIRAYNTSAIAKWVDFLHRTGETEDEAAAGLRAYQESMRRLKELAAADPDGTAPSPNGTAILPEAAS